MTTDSSNQSTSAIDASLAVGHTQHRSELRFRRVLHCMVKPLPSTSDGLLISMDNPCSLTLSTSSRSTYAVDCLPAYKPLSLVRTAQNKGRLATSILRQVQMTGVAPIAHQVRPCLPFWDPKFGSADLPMMMRIAELKPRSRKHLLAT